MSYRIPRLWTHEIGAMRRVAAVRIVEDRVRQDLTFSGIDKNGNPFTTRQYVVEGGTYLLPRNYPVPWRTVVPRVTANHLREQTDGVRDLRWMSRVKLRPGQIPAMRALEKGPPDKILVLGCGLGKTVVAADYALRMAKVPALVIVPTTALMEQWRERLLEHTKTKKVGRIQGDVLDVDATFTIAMLRTLALRKYPEWVYAYFRLVIFDECFPGSTLVDGRRIDSYRLGDVVWSYDHETGCAVRKRVTHVFKTEPSALVRVWWEDGSSVVCTPNHPFYARFGYVAAEDLRPFDETSNLPLEDVNFSLRMVQEVTGIDFVNEVTARQTQVERKGVLLDGAWAGGAKKGDSREVRSHSREEESRTGTVVDSARTSEPFAGSRSADANQWIITEDRTPTAPGRERAPNTNSPSKVGEYLSELESRVHGGNRPERGWVADTLYDRSGVPGSEGGGRDRRRKPSLEEGEETRRTEGSVLAWTRVDRVEVLEPGSDGTFGGVCPDGATYNLEVEDCHNYFVGEKHRLVHNCHRMGAPLLGQVAGQFVGERLSLTATVERDDGLHEQFMRHLGKVVYRDNKQDRPPTVYFVETGIRVNEAGYRMRGGKVNTARLYNKLCYDENRNAFIMEWVNKAAKQGRVSLILGERVAQLQWLCEHSSVPGGLFTGALKGENETRMYARRAEALTRQSTFGTSMLAKEGLDRKEFDTLFITIPIGGKGRLEQSLGRIARECEGKQDPVAVVFMDDGFSLQWDKFYKRPKQAPGFLPAMFAKMIGHCEQLGYVVKVVRATKVVEYGNSVRPKRSRNRVQGGSDGEKGGTPVRRRRAFGRTVPR